MFKRQSPLDQRGAADARAAAPGTGTVLLSRLPAWQLLQIGSFQSTAARLDAAVAGVIGSALPTSSSIVQHTGAHRLYRIACDQYWILTPDADLSDALAQALAPEMASLTPLSNARVRIALAGPAATALLGKVVSVDLRAPAFPAGSFAQTGLHHVGVLLERHGPTSFELHVLRTYAASVWDWLIDAALPLGYEVLSA